MFFLRIAAQCTVAVTWRLYGARSKNSFNLDGLCNTVWKNNIFLIYEQRIAQCGFSLTKFDLNSRLLAASVKYWRKWTPVQSLFPGERKWARMLLPLQIMTSNVRIKQTRQFIIACIVVKEIVFWFLMFLINHLALDKLVSPKRVLHCSHVQWEQCLSYLNNSFKVALKFEKQKQQTKRRW